MRFAEAFAACFRGGMAVFAAFSADVWVDFFVATGLIFLGSKKDFLNKVKKFGMFNTYGCARAHARC